jgi:hypothetical protein
MRNNKIKLYLKPLLIIMNKNQQKIIFNYMMNKRFFKRLKISIKITKSQIKSNLNLKILKRILKKKKEI